MALTFDLLLETVGLKPGDVHLVRHKDNRQGSKRSVYALWRDDRTSFELYQRIQGRPVFKVGNYVASFVATPQGETLFAGFYEVASNAPAPPGTRDPFSDEDCAGLNFYDLFPNNLLEQYVGLLAIDWGKGLRSWAQRGGRSPKPILAIKREFEEEHFPGYLRFIETLSGVATLPSRWRERLSEAKGVYVLTCPRTKELYVGSATGEGGFFERWCQHAAKGGDAVQFRSKEPSDYQVSILEVAGSNASERDILHAEQLWMQKLQTKDMGLNSATLSKHEKGKVYLPPEKLGLDPSHHDKFAVSGNDPFYVIQKDGKEVQLVIGEDGEVKRVPSKIPRPSLD